MFVIINELSSTVRATDSAALLHPQVLESIVRAVAERIREQNAHEAAVREDRRMRPSASAREAPSWE